MPRFIPVLKWIAPPLPLTGFHHDLGQHVCSEGGHLAGLANHSAAGSKGGGNLERQQVKGQVPGSYLSGHTHWMATSVVGGTDLG